MEEKVLSRRREQNLLLQDYMCLTATRVSRAFVFMFCEVSLFRELKCIGIVVGEGCEVLSFQRSVVISEVYSCNGSSINIHTFVYHGAPLPLN